MLRRQRTRTFSLETTTLALVAVGAIALSGCSDSDELPIVEQADGGGSAGDADAEVELPPDTCPEGINEDGERCISDHVLARKAVAYSGYRFAQDPRVEKYPSEAEIQEDLELLVQGGWTFIRLFDSGVHGQRVLKVIRDNDFDIKAQLGIWISGSKADHDAENQEQIELGIGLANEYADIVVAVSVGNETLDDWSSVLTPPEDLAEYMTQVRDEISQPVTTDDMFIPFKMEGFYVEVERVIEVADYLSVHSYAFIDAAFRSWNWKQEQTPPGPERAEAMMEAALEYTRQGLIAVREAMDKKGLDRPLIIGEAGWKSSPTKPADPGEEDRAHPVNQKMFYDRLMAWTYGDAKDDDSPKAAFYFEAFDEPWKATDDGWGLFDVERVPKHVISELFPELMPEDAPAYTEQDAIYFEE